MQRCVLLPLNLLFGIGKILKKHPPKSEGLLVVSSGRERLYDRVSDCLIEMPVGLQDEEGRLFFA